MRRKLPPIVAILLVLGTLAGLFGASKRWHVEADNRRVEIGVEWAEVSELAQITQKPVNEILRQFKAQGVSTLILSEETVANLEQNGETEITFASANETSPHGVIRVHNLDAWRRIENGLIRRGLIPAPSSIELPADWRHTTEFAVPTDGTDTDTKTALYRVPVRYAELRSLGVGLSLEGLEAAQTVNMALAGRIPNFAGVTTNSATLALQSLKAQGASTVIFTGDEVLGWRGVEKEVAALLRSEPNLAGFENAAAPVGLKFGAVEFGKQKGDAKIAGMLKGDYVRVHSIQTAEMNQLDEIEVVERFVRAARERNIRFCYVRLLPLAGDNPVGDNTQFLRKIAKGMQQGGFLTGGGLEFGKARPFAQTGVGTFVFVLLALGVSAGIIGTVWTIAPLSYRAQTFLIVGSALVCVLLVFAGDTGRRFLALLAGIAYPTWACLAVFPRQTEPELLSTASSIAKAFRSILVASGITLIGALHVIGLLATRPFLVQTSQYLGIKAQHAVPIFCIALVAVAGGIARQYEPFADFRARVKERLQAAFQEPTRFGTLLALLIILIAFALLVARTGNDAGVGVSGLEVKFRALLDRMLPVRPRTKEFVVGHPAFVLGLAWWFRGRRKWAVPTFVIGSIGQVSLLNTFCHIHSPLIISIWRGGLGLFLGALLGAGLFLLLELFLPSPTNQTTGIKD